jgi:hypothetical protein
MVREVVAGHVGIVRMQVRAGRRRILHLMVSEQMPNVRLLPSILEPPPQAENKLAPNRSRKIF